MKGVIFNVVEEVVTARYGEDTWDSLLEHADLEGAYTSLGNYDDDELIRLVGAAATTLGETPADVLRLVGLHGFAALAGRYPQFVVDHRSSRTVLADLNAVIHPQVLTLYPGAAVPEFGFRATDRMVELTYRSDRGLCHLAEGLAHGAADYFSEAVSINQPRCRFRGDDDCVIAVEYLADV